MCVLPFLLSIYLLLPFSSQFLKNTAHMAQRADNLKQLLSTAQYTRTINAYVSHEQFTSDSFSSVKTSGSRHLLRIIVFQFFLLITIRRYLQSAIFCSERTRKESIDVSYVESSVRTSAYKLNLTCYWPLFGNDR